MSKKKILIVLIILTSTVANAGPYVSLPSAAQLNADIEKFGAKQVLWDRLWEDEKVFYQLIAKVSSGDAEWVAVAVKLRAVSDAGASELLEMAMSRALAKHPVNVLSVLSSYYNPGVFSVEDICSGAMLFDSPESQIDKWRSEAISAVSGVNVVSLEEMKALCMKYLSKLE